MFLHHGCMFIFPLFVFCVYFISILSFQVENPVCVMTQDNSRKFLASSSAKDKYRFFETCTLLSTIRENLQLASGQIRCLRAVTGEKQRSLDILLTEMSCLEQKVKDLDRANHMQDDLEALTRKAIWAQIIEQEKVSSFFVTCLVWSR